MLLVTSTFKESGPSPGTTKPIIATRQQSFKGGSTVGTETSVEERSLARRECRGGCSGSKGRSSVGRSRRFLQRTVRGRGWEVCIFTTKIGRRSKPLIRIVWGERHLVDGLRQWLWEEKDLGPATTYTTDPSKGSGSSGVSRLTTLLRGLEVERKLLFKTFVSISRGLHTSGVETETWI